MSAIVGAALATGFSIATYAANAGSGVPVEILSERRILSSEYATLPKMEKVCGIANINCV